MLRYLREEDADGMMEWMHDEEVQKSFQRPMLSYRKEDALRFINNASYEIKQGCSLHYAIADDENDEYLGTISLKNIDVISRNAEYAIALRKKIQGHGIGKVATLGILKIAFMDLNLERVYLNVLESNAIALNLYETCGFTYEGTRRKHLWVRGSFQSLRCYSMLREEYISNYVSEKNTD